MLLAYYNSFAARPDQWRSKQASKQSAYKEFFAAFGSSETKSSRNDDFLADTSKHSSHPKDLKEMRKEIDHRLSSDVPFLSMSGFKSKPKKADQHSGKYTKVLQDDEITKAKNKVNKKKSHGGFKDAAAVVKMTENTDSNKKLQSVEKKRQREDALLNTSKKKVKT